MRLDELIQFTGTLANENRLKILILLKEGSKTVTEIKESLNLNQTTISHNLKRLYLCGFVEVKQTGKYRIYSLNKDTIEPLFDLIDKHTSKYCVHITRNKKISSKYKTLKLR